MIKIGSNKNIRLELSSRRTRWSSNLSEQKNQGHTFLFSTVWHWLLLRQVATLFSKSSNLRVQSFYWFLLGLHDDSIDTFIWWDHETSRVIDPGLCACWSRGPRTKHSGFFQIAMVGLPQSINKNAISWPPRYPWPIDVFWIEGIKGPRKMQWSLFSSRRLVFCSSTSSLGTSSPASLVSLRRWWMRANASFPQKSYPTKQVKTRLQCGFCL